MNFIEQVGTDLGAAVLLHVVLRLVRTVRSYRRGRPIMLPNWFVVWVSERRERKQEAKRSREESLRPMTRLAQEYLKDAKARNARFEMYQETAKRSLMLAEAEARWKEELERTRGIIERNLKRPEPISMQYPQVMGVNQSRTRSQLGWKDERTGKIEYYDMLD